MIPSRRPCAASLLAVLLVPLVAGISPAQDVKPDIAAKLLPAETAFYSSNLRLKQQFDAVAKSRAWKSIADKFDLDAPGGPFDKIKEIKGDPEMAGVFETVVDALSYEVFYAGGESVADLVNLYNRVQNNGRFDQAFEQLRGNFPDPKAGPRKLLKSLLADRELIKVPELMVGFKIGDAKRATKQIERLKGLIEGAEFKVPLKTIKIRGAEFTSAELTGDMVPWSLFPFNDFADEKGEFDPLLNRLKGLKVHVSVGVLDGYLLAAVGPSNAFLEKFGGAGPRLIDVAEFKPLLKHGAKPLTMVDYATKAYRTRTASGGLTLDDLFGNLAASAPDDVVDAKVRKKLAAKLKALSKEVEASIAAIGSDMSFTYLTDRGYESFHYDWSKHPDVDDSKPLTLANHVGGSPIAAFVMRAPSHPGDYDQLVDGLKEVGAMLDEASASWPEDKKKEYDRVLKAARPLLARLDAITGKMLVPALAEGQSAIVLDAKWTSGRWQKDMPVFYRPLPMPELALVFGVSDPALLEKAMRGYGGLIEDAYAVVRESLPKGKIPEFKFPKAIVTKAAPVTIWTWPLPKELGVDARVSPTLAVSDKVAVASVSVDHAERISNGTPLKGESKLLVDVDRRKLASIAVLDWARLIDAVDPWAEFIAVESLRREEREDETAQVVDRIHVVTAALKCFRGITTITYREGAPLVTQSEMIFRDLPAK